jgi:hypothetical protein
MAKKAQPTKRYRAKPTRRKKLARRRHVYNPQTGRIGGRAAPAEFRLERLTKKYQDEGLPLEEARQRARNEMRDNPRGDWRGG